MVRALEGFVVYRRVIVLVFALCAAALTHAQQGWFASQGGYSQRQNTALALDRFGEVYFTWTSGTQCLLRKYSRFGTVLWTRAATLPNGYPVSYYGYVNVHDDSVIWMYTVANGTTATLSQIGVARYTLGGALASTDFEFPATDPLMSNSLVFAEGLVKGNDGYSYGLATYYYLNGLFDPVQGVARIRISATGAIDSGSIAGVNFPAHIANVALGEDGQVSGAFWGELSIVGGSAFGSVVVQLQSGAKREVFGHCVNYATTNANGDVVYTGHAEPNPSNRTYYGAIGQPLSLWINGARSDYSVTTGLNTGRAIAFTPSGQIMVAGNLAKTVGTRYTCEPAVIRFNQSGVFQSQITYQAAQQNMQSFGALFRNDFDQYEATGVYDALNNGTPQFSRVVVSQSPGGISWWFWWDGTRTEGTVSVQDASTGDVVSTMNFNSVNCGVWANTVPPILTNDSYNIAYETPLNVAAPGFLQNDRRYGHATFVVTRQPRHGTLVFNQNGSFRYTPNVGHYGNDSFEYQASRPSQVSNKAVVVLNMAKVPGTWDAARDWSEFSNPNGVWRYQCGGVNLPRVSGWINNQGAFTSFQSAWAPGATTGFLPAFFKSKGLETFAPDWVLGDAVVHTNDPAHAGAAGEANIRWTAPFDCRVTISGNAWPGRTGRANRWVVSKNGVPRTFGDLPVGTTFTRANPFPFENGSGGSAALRCIPVAAGDTIDLTVSRLTTSGDFVGFEFGLRVVKGALPVP